MKLVLVCFCLYFVIARKHHETVEHGLGDTIVEYVLSDEVQVCVKLVVKSLCMLHNFLFFTTRF